MMEMKIPPFDEYQSSDLQQESTVDSNFHR